MTISLWTANTYYPKGSSYQHTDGYYYHSNLSGTFTGILTINNTSVSTISGISISGSTNYLYIGMAVSGNGIPTGTYISNIVGSGYAPTSITLSNNATLSGAQTITVNGYWSGATYDVNNRESNCSSLLFYEDVSDTFGEWRLKANQFAVNSRFSKPVPTVPGASVTFNAQISKIHNLTLSASVTSFNINNLKAGETVVVYVTQGAGSYTISGYGSNTQAIKWPGGTSPTITTTNGKIDKLTFENNGSYIFASIVQNY